LNELLIAEFDKDYTDINMEKIKYIFNPENKLIEKIDIKSKKKFTKENMAHLCLKNGHIGPLVMLLQTKDCTSMFKCVDHESKTPKKLNGHGDDGQVYWDYFKNTPIHSLTMNIHSNSNQLEEMWNIIIGINNDIEYHEGNI